MELIASELQRLYWDEMMSPYEIAEIMRCSFSTVTNRMKEYGILFKNSSLSRQKYPKYNFSGDAVEMAYMLGFRIGDLNVYKTNPSSETIVARCHTTTKEQLDVITRLFREYGRVTVSKNSDKSYHINCFLNQSFNFLLQKEGWENLQSKDEVFAFISGYIDAEGYLGLNQGKARLKIDSYDKEVIQWINSKLHNNAIRSKARTIGTCKDRRNFGKELWRLEVNHAPDLLNLISELKKYSLHQLKHKQLRICEANIIERRKNGRKN
ncbi:MAG TPA: LAGLIDADG family homing endonuclease [bacterium]|nr:LAGLIDADG family homing endonuclease [bacterium]